MWELLQKRNGDRIRLKVHKLPQEGVFGKFVIFYCELIERLKLISLYVLDRAHKE
ncbi:hypothetical protein ACT54M_13540 [Leptospira santarosai]|uniref:hypothetical protein n=1 Tax=Leptospira santarosai TaxID=28183 RepID=UPI00158C6BBB|nr:hypothetical protein [Leptospira santarosai]